MNTKLRHWLSSLIGAAVYFLFRNEPEKQQEPPNSSVVVINESNISKLKSGSWVVVTEQFKAEDLKICDDEEVSYGVLVVDSMEKAKIVAVLELKNPINLVEISNKFTTEKSANWILDTNVPLEKIIDYFVYYWALKINHILKSSANFYDVVEEFAFSILQLLFEISQYTLKGI